MKQLHKSTFSSVCPKGASEADIQKEIDGSIDREVTYDEHIDKITEAIAMGNLLLQYQELVRRAYAWLDHGVPSSAVFIPTVTELTKKFQDFIRELTLHSSHTDLGPLLPKAKDLLESLLININKEAPVPVIPAVGTSPAPDRLPTRSKPPHSLERQSTSSHFTTGFRRSSGHIRMLTQMVTGVAYLPMQCLTLLPRT